jgi:MFS family permease
MVYLETGMKTEIWANAWLKVVALLTFLTGWITSRAGRKKTALLAYIGLLLTFSCAALMLWVLEPHHVWLVPLSSIFLLIGGGEAVVTNTLNSMVADISPPHER